MPSLTRRLFSPLLASSLAASSAIAAPSAADATSANAASAGSSASATNTASAANSLSAANLTAATTANTATNTNAPHTNSGSVPTSDDAKANARGLALEGSRAADGGDHEKALGLFRDAYALYREPAYLYDIAVECQTLGRDEDALDAYERFLADPRTTPPEFVTHANQQREEVRARLRATAIAHPVAAPPSADERTDGATTSFLQRMAWQASVGAGFWTGGMRGDASPAPAFSIGAGYLVTTLPGDIDVRIGPKVAFTYFKEPSDTTSFVSALANPTLVKHLGRFSLYGEVGVGLVVLSGVPNNSTMLVSNGGRVTGALSAFELRPGVGAAYALTDSLSLLAAPSFVWIPRPQERFEYAALTRVDVFVGVTGQL